MSFVLNSTLLHRNEKKRVPIQKEQEVMRDVRGHTEKSKEGVKKEPSRVREDAR